VGKSSAAAGSKQVDFVLENGNAATADFAGGDVSPFGGLVLLSLVDDANQFLARAAKCIKDCRIPAQVKHTVQNLLRQVVLLTAAGYPDGIDSNTFKADKILKFCLGWEPDGDQDAASQASISRFLTARSKRELLRLFSFFISFYIWKHKKPPKSITLDFDGSAIEAHGRQQYIAFNGHYEINMYFPLFVLDQDGWLIAPILRPGNVSDAGITVDVLRILVKRFRRAWPNVEIILRGDAGFHNPEIMDWCESNGVEYILGLKGDHALNVSSQQFDRAAEQAFAREFGEQMFKDESKKKHELLREISAQPKADRRNAYAILDERQIRKLGEFRHRAGDGFGENDKRRQKRQWKQKRRVISLARVTDKGLKRRYLVTSLEGFTTEHIYDEVYSLRGRAEQCIRNFKSLGAARLNNHEANTNQFKLLIYGLVYNLFHLFKKELPIALRSLSPETIMHEFARIAVQIKVSTRRVWLRYTSSYRYTNQALRLIRRLTVLPKPA
jgi:hypothetical protein